ncbi:MULTISPECIES: hypothetical protein [Paenibacillus]|uniref:hypothetical protein n=1 Tax=Paenibacillus TaxID=44249 RepID=UPI001595D25A|nr:MULTISPECIES: hypothetical protein [Paenibacillus]
MNFEKVNNRINQLPIAMAGIVHAFSDNGRSLSNSMIRVVTSSRSCLPAFTDIA